MQVETHYNVNHRPSTYKVYIITKNLQLKELIFLRNTTCLHEITQGRRKSNLGYVPNSNLHNYNIKTTTPLYSQIKRTNKSVFNEKNYNYYNSLPSEIYECNSKISFKTNCESLLYKIEIRLILLRGT